MPNAVPSLEGSLYLTDPQSIIAYQLRRYFKQPADTIPLFGDMIISLPLQVAKYGREPDNLTSNIQSDLQKVYSRIFGNERTVRVSVNSTKHTTGTYDVTITVIYSQLSGEIGQTGITISIDAKGDLVIPEDTLRNLLGD